MEKSICYIIKFVRMWHYNQLKEVDDMDDQNKIASIVALAKNIIKHIQNRLYMQYHFLEQAIYRLNMVEITAVPQKCGYIVGSEPISC